MAESIDFEKVKAFRKELHQIPETAFEEEQTAKKVISFLQQSNPDKIESEIGGFGLLAFYQGKESGKTLLFRAELDALPIAESNDFDHRSKHQGKGHKCGHDGHMSILLALSLMLEKREFSGKVILLFQPAEETGEGAQAMMKDSRIQNLKVDKAYALHNLPGFQKSKVIYKDEIFAAASKGVIIKLQGKPSHASHPKDGINPALAVAEIIQAFYEVPQMQTTLEEVALITPVGMKMGQKAFGTSAADGEVYATIRTYRNETMDKICEVLESRIKSIADGFGLQFEISYTEEFKAVVNEEGSNASLIKSCEKLDFEKEQASSPFPWSEDFGQFSKQFPICFFGLGSGEDHPQLHNEDYDFPDELIETGSQLFYEIIKTENTSK
jgi:amidohydrolase